MRKAGRKSGFSFFIELFPTDLADFHRLFLILIFPNHSSFIIHFPLDQMFIIIQDFFQHSIKLYLCLFNNPFKRHYESVQPHYSG
ncbi:hypothetical protein CQ046_17925 [Chryseobacterium sp. MYb7]|nr:hypothetical protein CQ046_17925 [Chryseobacterium sp. MYb7]